MLGEEVAKEDMSGFDIPTVPLWLMNFHFRGQSLSVAATFVFVAQTAHCRTAGVQEIFHFQPVQMLTHERLHE